MMSITGLIVAIVASLVAVIAAVVTLVAERRAKTSSPADLDELRAAEKDLESALRNLRKLERSYARHSDPRPASGT